MIVDIGKVKLSVQRGLLGNVFPELRAVCVNTKENLIQSFFYIDGEISEKQIEFCESTIDQIIADFCNLSENIEFETPIIQVDFPKKLNLIGFWIYYRSE